MVQPTTRASLPIAETFRDNLPLDEPPVRSLSPNYLPLVTALENLIDVVGTSETHLFASLTENHYERLVVILDGLIDVVRENEDHLLASLMDFIGTLIEHYEDEHLPDLSEI